MSSESTSNLPPDEFSHPSSIDDHPQDAGIYSGLLGSQIQSPPILKRLYTE